ncbi:unknown [Collinsella sp. CAG:289]|nr:unknown [Collinsella sp. CAG:289]
MIGHHCGGFLAVVEHRSIEIHQRDARIIKLKMRQHRDLVFRPIERRCHDIELVGNLLMCKRRQPVLDEGRTYTCKRHDDHHGDGEDSSKHTLRKRPMRRRSYCRRHIRLRLVSSKAITHAAHRFDARGVIAQLLTERLHVYVNCA